MCKAISEFLTGFPAGAIGCDFWTAMAVFGVVALTVWGLIELRNRRR